MFIQVGPEKARLALSLVEYHSELEAAMEYVFGATFICETLSDAKQVICYIAETGHYSQHRVTVMYLLLLRKYMYQCFKLSTCMSYIFAHTVAFLPRYLYLFIVCMYCVCMQYFKDTFYR